MRWGGMEQPHPSDATTQRAADDVVEFALLALEPQYMVWHPATNAALAAFAWNAGHPRATAGIRHVAPLDPRMKQLLDALHEARRSRWGDRAFTVEDLAFAVEDDEMVFYFRLSWDDGQNTRPCRIVLDPPGKELLTRS